MKRENSKRFQRKTVKKTKVAEYVPSEKVAYEMMEAEMKVQKVRFRRYLATGSKLSE